MKSEVTTVINKPCCLIYHIRSNDDRAKELTESPPGNYRTVEQAFIQKELLGPKGIRVKINVKIQVSAKRELVSCKIKRMSYLEQIYYYRVFSICLLYLIRQTFQQYHHQANRKMISFRKTCFVHLMALLPQFLMDRNRRSFFRPVLVLIHRNLRRVFKLLSERFQYISLNQYFSLKHNLCCIIYARF